MSAFRNISSGVAFSPLTGFPELVLLTSVPSVSLWLLATPLHPLCNLTGLKPNAISWPFVHDSDSVLGIFWFKYREISCSSCFPRILLICSPFLMEMPTLLLMDVGGFVAKQNLLQYKSVLTIWGVTVAGLVFLSLLSQEGKLPESPGCLSILGWILKTLQRGKAAKTGKQIYLFISWLIDLLYISFSPLLYSHCDVHWWWQSISMGACPYPGPQT